MSIRIEQDGVLSAFSLPGGLRPSEVVEIAQPIGPRLASPVLDEADTAGLLDGLRAAGRAFRHRPVDERVELLGRVGARFRTDGDPVRSEALRLLPGTAGLSAEGAADVLDRMAADWTPDRLAGLVRSEFPAGELGAGFGEPRTDPAGRGVRRAVSVPPLILTICSGTVPGVSTTAVLRSLLVGAGTLVKPGAGDVVLPVLFAHALRAADAAAADALAVAYWPGGDAALEGAALRSADRVVVYGGDPTVRSVRERTPASTTLVEYRHRVGLLVAGAAGDAPDAVARDVVDAVVPYEQRGCVSPIRVYGLGRSADVRRLGEHVAIELERRASEMPGFRTPEEAAAAQHLLGALELRRAAGEPIEVQTGPGWSVVTGAPHDAVSGARVVLLEAVDSVEAAEAAIGRWRGRLQAVGVTGLDEPTRERVARAAASAGASRVGPAARMAYPPPWWIHDGRGPLHALVDLVEWERSD